MYGLEGILGNLITSVATPAIGGMTGEFFGSMVGDEAEKQLLKEITQTTTGALSGAAVGAGLGALTGGGGAGALSGALTGGVGGGLGGYNAQDISQIFGGAGSQQSVVPSQGGQPSMMDQMWQQKMQSVPTPGGAEAGSNLQQLARQEVSPRGIGLDYTGSPAALSMQDTYGQVKVPTDVTSTTQPGAFKGYVDFLKKNYEPLAGGFFLGSAIGANQDTEEQAKQYKQSQLLKDYVEHQNALALARSMYGYADGGPVEVGISQPEINVHFPAWAQEQIQREGGLAALQPEMRQGLANGGYINTQQVNPENFYPQSQMPKAQPYAAASPIRHEVINNFAHGGLIDGPGDGQSDSIPANISGREPVKVADGEYVVPRNVAAKYGPEKLHKMMTEVRKTAHAKKGAQIIQDAGKKAFIRTLSGVKA